MSKQDQDPFRALPSVLYALGLGLIPAVTGLSAVMEFGLGWTLRGGPGVGFDLLVSYLLCVAGALAMKKPLGRTMAFILAPLVILPFEVLFLGALTLWLFGFSDTIQ
ncbi:MAG: hypothetical protein M9920_09610 [Verrucomicrobiae bacterium]|nr:hypothetical protein [Verrucomicrobiae bacterium]